MSASDQAAHLKVYNTPEIVARYAAMDSVSACEQALFDSYLRQGMAILDLGVGAGRTTPHLSAIASRYVGIDYSEEMIRACRMKSERTACANVTGSSRKAGSTSFRRTTHAACFSTGDGTANACAAWRAG